MLVLTHPLFHNLLKMIMKTLFWVIVKSTYKYLFFV